MKVYWEGKEIGELSDLVTDLQYVAGRLSYVTTNDAIEFKEHCKLKLGHGSPESIANRVQVMVELLSSSESMSVSIVSINEGWLFGRRRRTN